MKHQCPSFGDQESMSYKDHPFFSSTPRFGHHLAESHTFDSKDYLKTKIFEINRANTKYMNIAHLNIRFLNSGFFVASSRIFYIARKHADSHMMRSKGTVYMMHFL